MINNRACSGFQVGLVFLGGGDVFPPLLGHSSFLFLLWGPCGPHSCSYCCPSSSPSCLSSFCSFGYLFFSSFSIFIHLLPFVSFVFICLFVFGSSQFNNLIFNHLFLLLVVSQVLHKLMEKNPEHRYQVYHY